jgi:hypothetical protein
MCKAGDFTCEALMYLSGVVALLFLWVAGGVTTGEWNPWRLIEGADSRPSTSKFQFFLWTAVVFFSYGALFAAKGFIALTEAPPNVLIAMGMVVGTMATAKGITVSYVRTGQVTKDLTAANAGAKGLLCDDDGVPDLSKIQMLAWTFIAIVAYLIQVVQRIHAQPHELPDIGQPLMVLMGLGQGAYLGKKLTSTQTPRLTGLAPGSGPSGTPITITGMSFGDQPNGSQITVDGDPIDSTGITWKDTELKFSFPRKGAAAWPAGRVLIGVIVGGQESANKLPFTVS